MTRQEATRAPAVLRALDRRELAAHRHRGGVARQLGLSDEELLVVLHLARNEDATHTELTTLLGLSRSGTSALLQRLERAGLLARHAHPADRRIRRLVLTDAARDRVAAAYAAHAAGVERVLEGFTPEEHETLIRFLDELAGVSEDATPGARAAALIPPPDRVWRSWG